MLDVNKTPLQLPEGSHMFKFNRWVTIFVAHFLAKRTLEFQSSRIFMASPNTFKKPKFKVFAVNSEDYSVPPWEEFKRVIREALPEKDNVNDIITTLEDSCNRCKGDVRTSLRLFLDIKDGKKKTLRLRMHCEAVFAALLEIRKRAQSKSPAVTDMFVEQTEIFKVLGLVCLDVKYFIHTFPALAARYDFSFQIVLPRLLGTFQSS